MSKEKAVVDLAEKRWTDGENNPRQHKPRDALLAALRDIDAGVINPDHLVVCYSLPNNDEAECGYYQAGCAHNGLFHSIGILMRVVHILQNPK
jgi:hypothetical protein